MFRTDLPQHLHMASYTLCVLLCVTSLAQCSVVSFTNTPSTIKPLVTDSLVLRCGVKNGSPTGTSGIVGKREITSTDHVHSSTMSLGHTSSDISKRDVKVSDIAIVGSITISKNNLDIAVITEHVPAKIFNNNGGVTGNVTASGAERGFLQVTWDYPDSSHSGSYICTVIGYDTDGHPHTLTETVDVNDNEVNLNDIVSYVHQLKLDNEQQNQMIEQQKQSIEQQKQSIEQQKLVNEQQNQLIGQQKQSIEQQKLINDQQKQLIEQQTTDITQLKGEISDLTTHVNTTVLFSAYLSSSRTVSSGQVLVFDKLRTSHGGGYSASTGIFTSPVAGYFMFHIHIIGQNDKQVVIYLEHNNNKVSCAWAEDGFDYNTASNSVALLLQKGDTVAAFSSGTSYLYSTSDAEISFSGYLINVL